MNNKMICVITMLIMFIPTFVCADRSDSIRISDPVFTIWDNKQIEKSIRDQLEIDDEYVMKKSSMYDISAKEYRDFLVNLISNKPMRRGMSCFYCDGSLFTKKSGRDLQSKNKVNCTHGYRLGYDYELNYHYYKILKCDRCLREFPQNWTQTEYECHGIS